MSSESGKIIAVDFDSSDEKALGLTDCGDILSFNLRLKRFNVITQINGAVLLQVFYTKKLHAAVGCDDGALCIVDCENGDFKKKSGHVDAIKIITFSQDALLCLTSCQDHVCLWDVEGGFQLKSTWKFVGCLNLMFQVTYCGQIVTGFFGKGIRVWKDYLGGKYKQVSDTENVTAAALTKDRRIVVFASKDGVFREYATKIWTLRRLVHSHVDIKDIKQMSFLNDDSLPKFILCLTNCKRVFILDFIKALILPIETSGPDSFVLCKNGKYLLSVYNGSVLLNDAKTWLTKKIKPKCVRENCEGFHDLLKSTLHENRRVIKDYLKLSLKIPNSSRATFWKYFLMLSNDVTNYKRLLSLGVHPKMSSLIKYDDSIPKKFASAHLRLCSNLAHWRPVLSDNKTLPVIAANFVKIFTNDPIAAFETLATLFDNHLQNWYSEHSNPPPAALMNDVERVLLQTDPELYYHYAKYQITPSVYAWPVMETLFSSVFEFNDWVYLADNIIVFGTYFILAATVAYNTLGRNSLLHCDSPLSLLNCLHTNCNSSMLSLLEMSHLILEKLQPHVSTNFPRRMK